MKSNRNFYSFLFIVLGLTITQSCKKSLFKRHAEGKVLDITDGTSIPSAEIAIISEKTEFLGSTSQKILATGKTDTNGEFEISYTTETDGQNVAYAKAEYYFNDPTTDYQDVRRSTRKNLEIKLTPKTVALVTFSVADSNVSYVYFRFRESSKSTESINASGGEQKYFTVRGNSVNSYLYIIYYKNGLQVKTEGTVFCPKYDKPVAVININI
jgi:hypothetical protein